MHRKATSSNRSTSPAAERIRLTLNLETVSLSKITEHTVEKLADICETRLSRYPRKLHSIYDDKRRWGGTYYPYSYFTINAEMPPDETVQVFVHEFGHAIHYAICDDSKPDAAHYKKTVTGVRDDNIKRLTGIYWKASQYVPALTDLFTQHKYASCVSVRDMYDRMQKDKELIPEAIFREFSYNLFSRYSLKNFNEYFCENFSAWITMAFPSDFAKAIGRLTEKYALTQEFSSNERVNVHRARIFSTMH